MSEHKCECCGRKKVRSEEEYKRLLNRLSRLEGQVRGVKKMIETDAYCNDILMQAAAISAALLAAAWPLMSAKSQG